MQQLTLEQRQKVEKWFAEKANVMGQCPVCRNRQFTLLDHMVAPPIFDGGGLTIGGPAYPMVMVMCTNCGNTNFHNAVVLGLLPGEGSTDTKPPPEDEISPNREAPDGG
jgi:predicted nucleic-acid-binding Zn-ribbon protein